MLSSIFPKTKAIIVKFTVDWMTWIVFKTNMKWIAQLQLSIVSKSGATVLLMFVMITMLFVVSGHYNEIRNLSMALEWLGNAIKLHASSHIFDHFFPEEEKIRFHLKILNGSTILYVHFNRLNFLLSCVGFFSLGHLLERFHLFDLIWWWTSTVLIVMIMAMVMMMMTILLCVSICWHKNRRYSFAFLSESRTEGWNALNSHVL